jgi:hypothetical protein
VIPPAKTQGRVRNLASFFHTTLGVAHYASVTLKLTWPIAWLSFATTSSRMTWIGVAKNHMIYGECPHSRAIVPALPKP